MNKIRIRLWFMILLEFKLNNKLNKNYFLYFNLLIYYILVFIEIMNKKYKV